MEINKKVLALCWTTIFLLILLVLSINAQTLQAAANFSALFQNQVRVSIDPLEVISDMPNQTNHGVYCSLSIHRENCLNPRIRVTEKIVWSTRICFKWTCKNSTTHAMRVENCWTGSQHMPLYLIDKNGQVRGPNWRDRLPGFRCTLERNMIGSPKYENSLLAAYSLGWLSVRLVGTDVIRLSCTIRLCDECDENCPRITPPRCPDSERLSTHFFTRWNQTEEWERACRPEESQRRAQRNSCLEKSPNYLIEFICCLMLRFLMIK